MTAPNLNVFDGFITNINKPNCEFEHSISMKSSTNSELYFCTDYLPEEERSMFETYKRNNTHIRVYYYIDHNYIAKYRRMANGMISEPTMMVNEFGEREPRIDAPSVVTSIQLL
jgi:hypothetical protein